MTTGQTPIHLVRALIVIDRERNRKASRTGFNLVIRIFGVIVLIVVLVVLLASGMAVGTAAAVYQTMTANLPTSADVAATFNQSSETTKIYDRTGKHLLYEMIDPNAGDRQWVKFEDMPDYITCGTVASEDKTFWTNPGFNFRGTARALWSNLQGEDIQGGSSITQQVVKNSVIPVEERYEVKYTRKIKEVLIALELTRTNNKETILEWYINTNFYGNLANGIDAAARVYFDKPVAELTLSEAATLIAIPQYPRMNPFDAPEDALMRKKLILQHMVEEGCVTTAEANAAEDEPWVLAESNKRYDIQAPHFAMYVRRELEEKYGPEVVAGGGLRVYTTLDFDLNEEAQCVTQAYLRILSGEDPSVVIPEAMTQGCDAAQYFPNVSDARIGEDFNVENAAVVVIRPTTGEILAMVGSADYWNDEIDGKFNVATDGLRQPGSSFKPFTYATFLAQGHNIAHMFLDVRRAFDQGEGMAPYVPENYTRKYYGPISLHSALARSLNIPAVEAMSIAGIDNVLRTAHSMGISTLDKGLQYYGLSLTLGGGEVKLLDMAYAFSVFDNNGVMYGKKVPDAELRPGFRELNPVAILRVEDRYGKILDEYSQPESRVILESRVSYLISYVLSDNQARSAAFGTPNAMELANERPAAVKTGTTNNFTDNWTVGYTPQYVTGVWMGNKDPNNYMINTTGSAGAAYIWHAVMEYAHKDLPIAPFTQPDGLEEIAVCQVSGLLSNGSCPIKYALMIPGTEPTEVDHIHQIFLVNRETGRLATIYTPPELVEHKVFKILPPEAADWISTLPDDQRAEYVPPTEFDDIGPSRTNAEVSITSPTPYAYVGGIAQITGNARGGNFALYRLVFGRGLNPTEWMQVGPDHGNQVENNVLENFDTTGLESVPYTLQLQVIGQDQQVRQAVIQVTVDNMPPKMDLTYPPDGSEFVYGRDEWVNINAEVQDNYAIDRVEFFTGGAAEPFKVRDIAPFNVNWTTGGPGQYSFRVIAYDAAGNKTETQSVTINVVARVAP